MNMYKLCVCIYIYLSISVTQTRHLFAQLFSIFRLFGFHGFRTFSTQSLDPDPRGSTSGQVLGPRCLLGLFTKSDINRTRMFFLKTNNLYMQLRELSWSEGLNLRNYIYVYIYIFWIIRLLTIQKLLVGNAQAMPTYMSSWYILISGNKDTGFNM